MTKQLNIRSDAAYEMAHALAREQNRSIEEVVEKALRAYGSPPAADDDLFAPEAVHRRYQELRELSARTAARKLPGATSDHSDLYDEQGLPK